MHKHGKRGLRPFMHTLRTSRLMAVAHAHIDALGPAPAHSFPWHSAVEAATHGDWQMFFNDKIGDCVIADDAHQRMLWTANNGGIQIPAVDDVVSVYSAQTGYKPSDPSTDQGTDPDANAEYLRKTGFLGHKIDAWAPIDPKNANHLKWACHLFGGVKFCVNLPKSAETEFDNQATWDAPANDGGIVGGHDVLGVSYYDEVSLDGHCDTIWMICTWGRLQKVRQEFIDKYLTVAIGVLSKDFINQAGVDAVGLKYDDLAMKLKAVAQAG